VLKALDRSLAIIEFDPNGTILSANENFCNAMSYSLILTISQDLIQPTPDVASQMAKDFVSGIVATDGRMISLIALDAILPAAEQAAA
jgi:hypothetical protein